MIGIINIRHVCVLNAALSDARELLRRWGDLVVWLVWKNIVVTKSAVNISPTDKSADGIAVKSYRIQVKISTKILNADYWQGWGKYIPGPFWQLLEPKQFCQDSFSDGFSLFLISFGLSPKGRRKLG